MNVLSIVYHQIKKTPEESPLAARLTWVSDIPFEYLSPIAPKLCVPRFPMVCSEQRNKNHSFLHTWLLHKKTHHTERGMQGKNPSGIENANYFYHFGRL